jgi:hypothetical protein
MASFYDAMQGCNIAIPKAVLFFLNTFGFEIFGGNNDLERIQVIDKP